MNIDFKSLFTQAITNNSGVGSVASNDFSNRFQSILSELKQSKSGSDADNGKYTIDEVGAIVVSVLEKLVSDRFSYSESVTKTDEETTQSTQSLSDASKNSPPSIDATARHVVSPGEAGAGLPVNYLKSELYQNWLLRKPEMVGDGIEYGKAITEWQESNPFYVNPKSYGNFDDYLKAVSISTSSGNMAAENDPYRMSSFMQTYYGTAGSSKS